MESNPFALAYLPIAIEFEPTDVEQYCPIANELAVPAVQFDPIETESEP